MNGLITLQAASERLGLSESSFSNKAGRQYPFTHKAKKGRAVFFDIKGYEKNEAFEESLREKIKLFVPFLTEMCGYRVSEIARIADVSVKQVSNLEFGFEFAKKIGVAFSNKDPYLIDLFDLYYKWGTVDKRKIARKIRTQNAKKNPYFKNPSRQAIVKLANQIKERIDEH